MTDLTIQPITPTIPLRFFHFSQNNSGGSFVVDTEAGIAQEVVIQATSPQEANAKAEAIGLYFNGCDAGIDCNCCGDRWYPKWDDDKGTEVVVLNRFQWTRPMVYIHYADGTIKAVE